jgi:hypothetical protein
MAVSYETKVLILTFAGSVLLAAVYLYVTDFLYTKATGRPVSQRYRDRVERWRRPLTRRRYLAFSALCGLGTLISAYVAVWSGEYEGWGKLIPLGWMIYAGVLFCLLQIRWRRQQADLRDQLSGGAR